MLKVRADHAEAFEAETQANLAVVVADAEVRRLALEAFAIDKTNKQVADGVSIAVGKRVDLTYDPEAAFAWAYEHKIAVVLDKKAFEQLCEMSAAKPAFVGIEYHDVPSVKISSKLPYAEAAKAEVQ